MDLYHVLSMIVIRVKHLVVGHACTRDKLNSTHQNVYFFFKVHLLIYISRQIVSLVSNIIFETAPPLLSDIFLLLIKVLISKYEWKQCSTDLGYFYC